MENKMNAMAFPNFSKSIVIFERGYGISTLKNAKWLRKKRIFYWGDIDVQGFGILVQIRNYFPHTQSMFMDQATFERYRNYCVTGK